MPTKPAKGKPKARMGRPPVADADRRDTLIRVLVTESEHEELQTVANAAGLGVSTWLRSVALERARGGTR
jgi:hypothetical protein